MKAKADSSASGVARVLSAAFAVVLCALVALVCVGKASGKRSGGSSAAARATEPWTDAQTVTPAELVKELAANRKNRPVVVYVGDRSLYEGAHIPGAVFHGPAFEPAGSADLKKMGGRNSALVQYGHLLWLLPARKMLGLPSKPWGPWASDTCVYFYFPAISTKTGIRKAIPVEKGK